jgi:alkylation response protein AidB-like acyl-CoA dehydrogenase
VLSPAPLENPYTSDPSFQRILSWYLPSPILARLSPLLTTFGSEAISPETDSLISNAERQQPYVKQYNVFGQRYPIDHLVTSHGWKALGKWGISRGVVALGYEDTFGPYRRIAQHAHNYIYSASSAVYSCPVSMTSGAARLFQQQCRDKPKGHVFHEIYAKLVAREGNWISAQWMTERPGGSDVRNSETVAVHAPLEGKEREVVGMGEGEWLVSGFKWFSSATDCDVALMLAKTESGKLSLFVAPTRRKVVGGDGKEVEVTNGIRIHRLKNKMGTKELPTAELELKDVRAHLVGEMDRGIPTIATLLNVTRTHNFITALSCWRRSMYIAKSFAKARTTIDQPLWLFPMHLRLLAGVEVKHQGLLQLGLFTTALLSFIDNGHPPNPPAGYPPIPKAGAEIKMVLRTLTATTKAVTCKIATAQMFELMEAMGGVGYMDEPDEPEFNIARLMRDTAANMVWEGTTNVLSSEVTRHILKGGHLELLSGWLTRSICMVQDEEMRSALIESWSKLNAILETGKQDLASILAEGRQVMFSISWIISGMLLAHDAQGDGHENAGEIARRWILDGEGGVGDYAFQDVVYSHARRRDISQKTRSGWDCRIVWDVELPTQAALGYREAATDLTAKL